MKKTIFLIIAALLSFLGSAHTLPHSVMSLDIRKDAIHAKLSLPLKEFQSIYPRKDLKKGREVFIKNRNAWLDTYLLDHVVISDPKGNLWKIQIAGKHISHRELTYELLLQPPAGVSPRNFILDYDVIIHHLPSHKLFLEMRSDWYGGMREHAHSTTNLGTLMADPLTGALEPMEVHLEKKASPWNGFKLFVELGMEQIKTGTDHLLFLIVLMFSTVLTVQNRRWTNFQGTSGILIRVLKIATAFTIGYSLALIAGAMQWLAVPQQWVDVAIAGTILITAIHAIRPVFPGKEGYAAIVFGLIHGLSFSGVIADLNLDGERLFYSTLGFSAGVELMQLFIILCIVPWLVLVSKYPLHKIIRIGAGFFAIVVSSVWIVTHAANEPNVIADCAERILSEGKWLIAALVFLAVIHEIYQQVRMRKTGSGRRIS